jgi:hypothetical protein
MQGPEWGERFAEVYEQGVLAATATERLYWRVRDPLACSRSAAKARAWREAGRAELTTRAVEERLDAYVRLLMDSAGLSQGKGHPESAAWHGRIALAKLLAKCYSPAPCLTARATPPFPPP